MKNTIIALALLFSLCGTAQKKIIFSNTSLSQTMQIIHVASGNNTGGLPYFVGNLSATLTLGGGSSYTMSPAGGGTTTKFPFSYLVGIGMPSFTNWVETASGLPITTVTQSTAFADPAAPTQVLEYVELRLNGGTSTIYAAGTFPSGTGGSLIVTINPTGTSTVVLQD